MFREEYLMDGIRREDHFIDKRIENSEIYQEDIKGKPLSYLVARLVECLHAQSDSSVSDEIASLRGRGRFHRKCIIYEIDRREEEYTKSHNSSVMT